MSAEDGKKIRIGEKFPVGIPGRISGIAFSDKTAAEGASMIANETGDRTVIVDGDTGIVKGIADPIPEQRVSTRGSRQFSTQGLGNRYEEIFKHSGFLGKDKKQDPQKPN